MPCGKGEKRSLDGDSGASNKAGKPEHTTVESYPTRGSYYETDEDSSKAKKQKLEDVSNIQKSTTSSNYPKTNSDNAETSSKAKYQGNPTPGYIDDGQEEPTTSKSCPKGRSKVADAGDSKEAKKQGKATSEDFSDVQEPSTTKCYAKGGLALTLHGNIYQVKLATLLLILGIHKQLKFLLRTECIDYGKLEDVSFSNQGNKTNYYFQAKHKQVEPKNISAKNLLQKDGDFALQKYFISHVDLEKKLPKDDGETHIYLLYTNMGIKNELQNCFVEVNDNDDLFDIKMANKEPKRYKLDLSKFPEKESLITILKNTATPRRLVNTIVDCVKNGNKMTLNNSLFKLYHIALRENKVFDIDKQKFHIDFVKNKNLSSSAASLRDMFLEAYDDTKQFEANEIKFQLSRTFGIEKSSEVHNLDLPSDVVTDEQIKAFFDRLQFAVNQPNETELDTIMIQLLEELQILKADSANAYTQLNVKVLNWMKARQGTVLSQVKARELLDKVKRNISGALRFEVKAPVSLFTGRDIELVDLHKMLEESDREISTSIFLRTIVVCGLGGIGKTELIRKFIALKDYYYDNIICLDATSNLSLSKDFEELARDPMLGIDTTIRDDKEKSTQKIVREVYTYLRKRKCLLFFDNVEYVEDFSPFLPKSSIINNSIMHILITSRIIDWKVPVKIINLKEMEKDEAIELAKKGLKDQKKDKKKVKFEEDINKKQEDEDDDNEDEDTDEDTDIESLVNEVQYLPLAIIQSTAYIKNKRATSSYEIEVYIEEFHNKKAELFDFRQFEGFDDNEKTILTTWKITIERIYNEEKTGKLAIHILYMLAYFNHRNIMRHILLNIHEFKASFIHSFKTKNKRYVKEAISTLIKFCMINSKKKQSVLNIHRVVQEVLKLYLTGGKGRNNGKSPDLPDVYSEETAVVNAHNVLSYTALNSSSTPEKEIETWHQILPHLEALTIYLYGSSNFLSLPILDAQLILLEKGYFMTDDFKTIGELLARELKKRNELYPEHSIAREEILRKIDYCKYVVENNDETVNCHLGLVSPSKLFKRGTMYGDLHNFNKPLELLQQHLADLGSAEEHEEEVASVKLKLGIIYNNLRDHKKAKVLLEQAWIVFENNDRRKNLQIETAVNLCVAYKALCDQDGTAKMLEKITPMLKTKSCVTLALALCRVYGGYKIFDVLNAVQKILINATFKVDPAEILAPNLWQLLGNVYADLGKISKACKAYKKASSLICERPSPPWYFACIHGNVKVIEELTKYETNIDYYDMLQKAALGDKVDAMRWIILNISHSSSQEVDVKELLMLAAEKGNIAAAKVLFDYGAKMVDQLDNLLDILNKAVLSDSKNMVEIVLAKIPTQNLNSVNVPQEKNPLKLAAINGKMTAVRILLEKCPSLTENNENATVIHYAANTNDEITINDIVNNVKNKSRNFPDHIDVKDADGNTALMWAAKRGKFNAVKALLGHGANVEEKNHNSETVLHNAIASGYAMIVEHILEHLKLKAGGKCNLNAKNHEGNTPLMDAIQKGHECVIQKLLSERDVDIFVQNTNRKENIIHLATDKCDGKLIEDLYKRIENTFKINFDDQVLEGIPTPSGKDTTANGAPELMACLIEILSMGPRSEQYCNIIISDNRTIADILQKHITKSVHTSETIIIKEHVAYGLIDELANDPILYCKTNENLQAAKNHMKTRIPALNSRLRISLLQNNTSLSSESTIYNYSGINKSNIRTMREKIPNDAVGSMYLGVIIKNKNDIELKKLEIKLQKDREQVYTDIKRSIEEKFYEKIINAEDIKGRTPLRRAVAHGNVEAVKVLAKYDKNIDEPMILHEALRNVKDRGQQQQGTPPNNKQSSIDNIKLHSECASPSVRNLDIEKNLFDEPLVEDDLIVDISRALDGEYRPLALKYRWLDDVRKISRTRAIQYKNT